MRAEKDIRIHNRMAVILGILKGHSTKTALILQTWIGILVVVGGYVIAVVAGNILRAVGVRRSFPGAVAV